MRSDSWRRPTLPLSVTLALYALAKARKIKNLSSGTSKK